MEKSQLVNFIGKMMEDSGFKIYKNFKASDKIIDIYAVLPTLIGDFGVVVTCKNYDKQFNVGIEILKDMEMISKRLKASKVVIVTSSSFSSQAINYSTRKDIKLIDREDLIKFAKKFSKENNGNIPSSNNENFDSDKSSNLKPNRSLNQDNTFLEKTKKFGSDEKGDRLSNPKNSSSTKNKNILGSIFSRNNKQSLQDTFNNKPKKKNVNYGVVLKTILNNAIIMIIIVVLLSYFIPYTLEKLEVLHGKETGILEILLSLILSFGMVLLLNKNKAVWIIKGTIVFFSSVAILIILIFVL
ncbi:MAG: restriction endonuclease [Methanobrevibacter sp.]|jgi:hypothetical protein|nr:restriction endonuclease [Candidatus Methanovirga meridionalis]